MTNAPLSYYLGTGHGPYVVWEYTGYDIWLPLAFDTKEEASKYIQKHQGNYDMMATQLITLDAGELK